MVNTMGMKNQETNITFICLQFRCGYFLVEWNYGIRGIEALNIRALQSVIESSV